MNILICSVGLSPQVVTETLYALEQRRWRPDRIVILTTRGGKEACEKQLLIQGGGLDQFRTHVNGHLPKPDFVLASSDSGDIETERELIKFASCAHQLLKNVCADPHTTLFLSLAGGRKASAVFLSLIMAVYGREQDRMFHVTTKPDMVSVPDFWFPTQRRIALPKGRSLEADDVEINLLEIPFPRFANASATAEDRFWDFLEGLSGQIHPRLVIGKEISWDGEKLKIAPALAAWLRWLATSEGVPRVGACRSDYLSHYRHFAGIGRTEQQLKRLPDPLDSEWIEEKANRIVKLGKDCGIAPNGKKLVLREGEPGRAIYRLALDPIDVHIVQGTG